MGYSYPINYVTLYSSEKNYNYKEYAIDGVKIYYTNEAIDDGKVLGGFFVDSDLMIKYNIGECQIIDTSKISELLYSNKNKLYKNSLNFEPYKDDNIDKKGKAYLKWCIPGVWKERNITLVKKLTVEYELNQTTNKELTTFMKDLKIFYFISLPGYILITIGLIITTIIISYKKINAWVGICMSLTLFLNILVLIGTISSNVKLSSSFTHKPNYYQNIFNIIITLDIAIFWINIPLTVFSIFSFCYLFFYLNENVCNICKKKIIMSKV